MCHFLVHDWLKKLFLIFTNSTSPRTTLYHSYTTINIVQFKYFRRTIYYDTVLTVDARSDLDRTVQRRPTKACNAKVENAHVYLVHSLSSNYVEIRVRNYVTGFRPCTWFPYSEISLAPIKQEKSIPLSVLQAVYLRSRNLNTQIKLISCAETVGAPAGDPRAPYICTLLLQNK
jgi:hypothetical protein